MYQKFIINQDGVLKFGTVYMHKDLLVPGEKCIYGGGLWKIAKVRGEIDACIESIPNAGNLAIGKIDHARNAIMLYGRSFDFGPPDFDYVRKIDWTGVGGKPCQLLFLPHWPDEDEVEPVFAKRD